MKKFLFFCFASVFVCFPAFSQTREEIEEESAVQYLKQLNAKRPKSGLAYKMKVKSADGTLEYTTYAQNGKWRMDGNFQGQKSTVLYDGHDTTVIMGGMAIRQKVENFAALPDDDELNGYSLGDMTEKNGYPCRMIYNDDEGLEMCVHETYTLPVYAKTDNYVMNVTDIRKQDIPEKKFLRPAGVKPLDMNQMMQNMLKISD